MLPASSPFMSRAALVGCRCNRPSNPRLQLARMLVPRLPNACRMVIHNARDLLPHMGTRTSLIRASDGGEVATKGRRVRRKQQPPGDTATTETEAGGVPALVQHAEQAARDPSGTAHSGDSGLQGSSSGDEPHEEPPCSSSSVSSPGGDTPSAVPRLRRRKVTAVPPPPLKPLGAGAKQLHADIMQRRCPRRHRFGHGNAATVTVAKARPKERYALREDEMPPALKADMAAFIKFSTQGSYAAQSDPVRKSTCNNYIDALRQALGWLHKVQGIPLEELRLQTLVPSINRKGVRLVHDFIKWLEIERGLCRNSLCNRLLAFVQLAKFLYHEDSNAQDGDKPYSDLQVVKALRTMYMNLSSTAKVEGKVVDEQLKWMDWPEYLDFVDELKTECAGLTHDGKLRPRKDVAMALQIYLIAAILSCIPDRQRTLRELQVGRTLVKDREGRWVIRHGHEDYKTGKTYGERPPLVIAPHIYPELEAFMHTWRAELQPQHNFLFSRGNGQLLDRSELWRLFVHAVHRLTGKRTNPHLVRDMIVTYARDGNATEHELEALALYMGHSLAEQRGTYDRRTKAQKVSPAMGLLAKFSNGRISLSPNKVAGGEAAAEPSG